MLNNNQQMIFVDIVQQDSKQTIYTHRLSPPYWNFICHRDLRVPNRSLSVYKTWLINSRPRHSAAPASLPSPGVLESNLMKRARALFKAFCMTRRPDGNFSHQTLQHNSQQRRTDGDTGRTPCTGSRSSSHKSHGAKRTMTRWHLYEVWLKKSVLRKDTRSRLNTPSHQQDVIPLSR